VTAAPAKIAICLARYPRLELGNRFDDQLRLLDEIAVSMASAQAAASGSSRRIAISADVSMIIAATRSHHPALIIKQVTVIDCTEGLLEMRRAIFADRQQAICQSTRPFTTHAIEALAHGLRDSDGHTLSSNAR
jgi:hypothetical protein